MENNNTNEEKDKNASKSVENLKEKRKESNNSANDSKDNEEQNKINAENDVENDDNYIVEREYSIENIQNLIIKDIIPEKNKKEKKEELNQILIEPEQLKCNKEYKDNDNDLISRRFATKDNNDKYLIIKEDKNKNANTNNKDENYNSDSDYDSDREEEKKDLFPFKIIGDAEKKKSKIRNL